MKSKKEIIDQFQEHYNISKSGLAQQYKHIEECRAFYAGDYMNYRDTYQFGRGQSRVVREVSFNRVKPYVNSIVGFFAQMRRQPDYQARVPEEAEQRALSDYLNGLSDYVRQNMNADQIETQQDKDLVIGGVGITDTGITLKGGAASRLPGGEVLLGRVDPLHAGWDPLSVAPNVLDSRWVFCAKDFDVKEAENLLDADPEDFEYANADDSVVNYEFNPYGGIQDKIGYEWSDPQRRRVRVYFYQWYDVENYYRIDNPLYRTQDRILQQMWLEALSVVPIDPEEQAFAFNPEAEFLVMTKENLKQVKEVFARFNLPFKPITEKRKCYYTAILSGSKVFDYYKSPSQQGFTLKFKTGDRDEVNNMWTGVVASLRDPQRYYNKSLTEIMLIIANNSRGGVMYEESAITNIQEFEDRWARMNAAVKVADGALSGGRIMPKATPHLQTGYEEILAASNAAMGQVTGIDESFFGAITGGNETAMLQRQRIKQATTALACYMDNIVLYTREQARLMIDYIRLLAQSSEGSMFRMEDDEGNVILERVSTEYMAEEYDIVIGEMPDTATQKEYYTQTLITMAQSMQAIGDPRYLQMYAAAVKYMPIQSRDKAAIIETLVGKEQIDPNMVAQMQNRIQELESQAAQLEMAKRQADIGETVAKTETQRVEALRKQAEIGRIVEDTDRVAIENDLMAIAPENQVNVNI